MTKNVPLSEEDTTHKCALRALQLGERESVGVFNGVIPTCARSPYFGRLISAIYLGTFKCKCSDRAMSDVRHHTLVLNI